MSLTWQLNYSDSATAQKCSEVLVLLLSLKRQSFLIVQLYFCSFQT